MEHSYLLCHLDPSAYHAESVFFKIAVDVGLIHYTKHMWIC